MSQTDIDQLMSLLRGIPGLTQSISLAILLFSVFFFTSTLASHLLEAFVGLINARGRQLERRLELALGAGAKAAVYGSDLIRSLASA